jgi:diguanylate cyclase (GGDEF)-like protein
MRRHLRELSQHRQEMALLGEMSSFLQHATHEREAVDVVTAYGPRLFPDAGATVYLLPPSRDALERAAHWGEGAPADGLDPNDCWALRRALPRKWAPADPAPCRHYGSAPTGHHVCVPMAAHGTVLGLVTISAPTAEGLHETSARSIADQLGLALSNLQLRETLRSMSIRDPLTGLFNRRYLEETALREVNRAKRRSQPLTVLMIDADHFKRLNDTHGHDKGDEALRVIGRVLRDNVRGEDAPCRLGGEELVVLLGDCSYENGLARAEQIRAQVRQATHPQVTLSIGVASYPEHAGTWTDLLRAADQAVYRAKAEGRDRVVGAAPTT